MKNKICPVCGKKYSDYPALSRRDNKTEICPDCGIREAIEDFQSYKKLVEDEFGLVQKEGSRNEE